MSSGGPGVVVLSPHLDDAVLSLGATIGRMAAEGRRVEVWTAFTGGPDPRTLPRRLRPFGDYPTRVAEDDHALAVLGATPRRLGLTERVWRDLAAGARAPGSLRSAFRTPATAAGFAELSAIEAAVHEALADPAATLYAPLGVGGHADHVEVAVATLRAVAGDPTALDRVRFYEDFYTVGAAQRRRHPVTGSSGAGGAPPSPGRAAPLLGAGLRLLAAVARGPGLAAFVPQVESLQWRCQVEPADGFEHAKLDAVAEYRSQVARMGGGRRVAAVLTAQLRGHGGEPVWRAGP